MEGFEAAYEVHKLTLEDSDRDFWSYIFVDYDSLFEFWVRDIEDRLASWMEPPEDLLYWLTLLKADENKFIDEWAEKYCEWWATGTDVVWRHVNAPLALRRIVDGDDQDQDDGRDS